jgi:hypothetical protein
MAKSRTPPGQVRYVLCLLLQDGIVFVDGIVASMGVGGIGYRSQAVLLRPKHGGGGDEVDFHGVEVPSPSSRCLYEAPIWVDRGATLTVNR